MRAPGIRSTPVRSSSPRRYSTSLLKAVQLLEAFEPGEDLSATEMASVIGADRSTAFRVAQALVQFGWLRQDPASKRYRPGLRLWELGTLAISEVDVRRAARPYMRTLATATGESSDLAILDGADCVYIERVQSSAGVRVLTRIGTRIPAHALAMGKVLLAYLPAGERRRRVSARLQAFTSRTLTSLEELDRECERALLDRFAVNYGEWRPDAGGIAAPIFDRLGCVAAISIDAPLDRLDTPSISTLATLVKNAAAGVSRESGADMAQVGYAFE